MDRRRRAEENRPLPAEVLRQAAFVRGRRGRLWRVARRRCWRRVLGRRGLDPARSLGEEALARQHIRPAASRSRSENYDAPEASQSRSRALQTPPRAAPRRPCSPRLGLRQRPGPRLGRAGRRPPLSDDRRVPVVAPPGPAAADGGRRGSGAALEKGGAEYANLYLRPRQPPGQAYDVVYTGPQANYRVDGLQPGAEYELRWRSSRSRPRAATRPTKTASQRRIRRRRAEPWRASRAATWRAPPSESRSRRIGSR